MFGNFGNMRVPLLEFLELRAAFLEILQNLHRALHTSATDHCPVSRAGSSLARKALGNLRTVGILKR